MRRPTALVLVVVGAVLIVVSLYLPWLTTQTSGLLRGFLPGSLDGWATGIGSATALAAVLAAATATVDAITLPETQLPIGLASVLAAYLCIALVADLESIRNAYHRLPAPYGAAHFHYAYGAYVGLLAAGLLVLAAGAYRAQELRRARSWGSLAALALTAALLTALLLPWQHSPGTGFAGSSLGIASPSALLAAPLALGTLALWWRDGRAAETARAVLAAATALVVGGAFSQPSLGASRVYGAWVALAVAVALAVLTLAVSLRGLRAHAPLRGTELGAAGAAALFLASLFLPWQSYRGPNAPTYSLIGWSTTLGAAVAALAIAIVVGILAWHPLRSRLPELAVGLAVLTATLGIVLAARRDPLAELAYGAFIGLTAVGLLLVAVLLQERTHAIARGSIDLVPAAACAVYVAVLVVPWWDVLSARVEAKLAFGGLSWLEIAGALLAVGLAGLWLRRAPGTADALVAAPLVMLVLVVLDIVRLDDAWRLWGTWILVGLSLLLTLLGWLERRTGLESVRVPELLRVDRI